MWNWFYKLASPPHFYRTATLLEPWLLWPAVALLLVGAYGGLVMAPPDYLQGEGFCIIYLHVPAAFLFHFRLRVDGCRFGHRADLAYEAGLLCGCCDGSGWCCFYLSRARHRCHLGAADVGQLVGVGPAPDLGTGFVVSVSWLHFSASGVAGKLARLIAPVAFWL